jgi:RimJ/RimL family protein N-acetyltransferase
MSFCEQQLDPQATQALAAFLGHVAVRSLYAYVARHNVGSIRVLEKCRFMRCGEEHEEVILKLASTV